MMALLVSTSTAQLFDDHPIYRSYLSETTPVIDGIIDVDEWAAAGPPIVINSMSLSEGLNPSLHGHPYGGDEDLSFQFRSMWVAPWDLYFLVEINDDIATDAAHMTDRLWERDQLEFFLDGDQLTGGNIRWWDTNPGDPVDSEDTAGPGDPYGKLGIARPEANGDQLPYDGQTGKMSTDPGEVGENGIIAAAAAARTGVNENYFIELRVSMVEAAETGLFDGTNVADFGTLIPEETALKFSMFISDNDNTAADVESDDGRTHGAGVPGGELFEGPVVEGSQFVCSTKTNGKEICGLDGWWRSDRYPSLLLSDIYDPGAETAACDFDSSGSCDIADVNDLIYNGIPTNDPIYDLDGSGTVDIGDRDEVLRAIASLPGDANTDGTVDANDLNAVGGHWQQNGITSFADGDFNGDGIVNASDLSEVGLYWTQTAAEFSQSPAAAAVPEPAAESILLLGALLAWTVRRR